MIQDSEFLELAFKHRRYLRMDGTNSEITSPQDITEQNQLKDIRLSSRGYKLVGRRELFK